MIRVDGHYLYQVGYQIHPLSEFRYQTNGVVGTTKGEAYFPLVVAEGSLETLLNRSIFQLRTSFQAGQKLLSSIKEAKQTIDLGSNTPEPLDALHVYQIQSSLNTFEAVLGAELALLPLYVVIPKGAYDTAILIEAGSRCFPEDLSIKVPEAVEDIEEATRCLAFELFTASGFHFHRANESVLHRYWDVVTDKSPRPKTRNMGDYINEMNKLGVGDGKAKSALKDLKDLHRNPLIHAEDSIKTADRAIALMNSVHITITCMLDEIPIEAHEPAMEALSVISAVAK